MTTTTTRIATAPIHAVLPAEDLARAREFYHDLLGFEVEDMPELRQFFIHAGGGTRVLVYERKRTVAEHTAAGLVVDDLESTVRELRDLGVVFEEYELPGIKTENGIALTPMGSTAWFKDPEGNIIAVSQMA